MDETRRIGRALALALMCGAGTAAWLFAAALAASADVSTPVSAAGSDSVVPASTTPKRVSFGSAIVLDSHAPSGRVTNIYGGPETEQNASIATDATGHWVAVWHSSDPVGGRAGHDFDILVSRSTDNGLTWTRAEALNSNAGNDSGDDLEPMVQTDKNGVWIVVWTSDDTFGGRYGLDRDVFYARSTDNGATWSAPAPLNLNAEHDWGKDEEARIAADALGNWVAVWSSTDTLGNRIGGDSDILVARSNDKGQTWTYPIPLNNNATADEGFDSSPDVVTDGAGRWIAAWSAGGSGLQGIGNDRDILFAHSEDKGATWSDPTFLNSNATFDESSDSTPRLATDSHGKWLAVWSSADALRETIGIDRDILVSRSADDGKSWSDVRALNRNAATDAGEDASPAVVSDGLGGWLVAWHAWGDLGGEGSSDADIVVSYSADDGTSWTDAVHINDHAAGAAVDDLLPALAADGHGHSVVVWQSFNPPDFEAKDSEWRILAATITVADGKTASSAPADAAGKIAEAPPVTDAPAGGASAPAAPIAAGADPMKAGGATVP